MFEIKMNENIRNVHNGIFLMVMFRWQTVLFSFFVVLCSGELFVFVVVDVSRGTRAFCACA